MARAHGPSAASVSMAIMMVSARTWKRPGLLIFKSMHANWVFLAKMSMIFRCIIFFNSPGTHKSWARFCLRTKGRETVRSLSFYKWAGIRFTFLSDEGEEELVGGTLPTEQEGNVKERTINLSCSNFADQPESCIQNIVLTKIIHWIHASRFAWFTERCAYVIFVSQT